MTFLKKYLSLLLVVVLCLQLAACGGSADEDWRNSGDVVASGTITRSDGDVDVLVTVDDNNAYFYWDDAEQTVFDSVAFPFEIPNAKECFQQISFADVTANGESDVEIIFTTDSGKMYLVWLWDMDGYFVFRGDQSTYTIDGCDLSEYVGRWQWENESIWLEIYEDGSWAMFDAEDNVIQFGTLWLSEVGIVLYFFESGDVLPLDVTVSGDLVNLENEMTFVPAGNSVDLSDYIGLWEYVGENLWLRIYDDESWAFFNDQEDAIATGMLVADASGITLYFDGSDDVMQLDFAVSGDLLDAENSGTLVPAEKIVSRVPFFARNGLEINAAMDTGTYWLANGVCSYSSDGKGYYVGDCYWEVTKNYDQTHDGIREIQFDAIAYIPKYSIGSFQQTQIEVSTALYDYYTGAALPVSATHNNSERGDNYYVYAIEWNGESVEIEFAFSSEWQFYVGDWVAVLTRSYIVYLPEGYDGLVLSLEPQPDNRSDYDNKTKMNDTWDGMTIMDIDALDPYGCLFFSVCD